jgi:hypothetical protein
MAHVAKGEADLVSDVRLVVQEQLDSFRKQTGIEDALFNLRASAGADVGEGPAGFPPDCPFGVVQQSQQQGEYVIVEQFVGLRLATR